MAIDPKVMRKMKAVRARIIAKLNKAKALEAKAKALKAKPKPKQKNKFINFKSKTKK